MKLKALILTILIAALVFTGCGSKAAAWSEFKSDDGAFTVSAPAGFKVDESNSTADVKMFSFEDKNELYMVAFTDFGADALGALDPNELLTTSVDTALQSLGGTQTDSKDVALDTFPGREVTFTLADSTDVPGGGTAKARFYIAEGRFYQVLAVAKGKNTLDNATKFLESFKVVK